MSLAKCIRKAGKALNTGDADSISTLADEIEATGVERSLAETQAVDQHLTNVQSDIDAMLPTSLDQGPTDDIPRGLFTALNGEHTIELSASSDVSTFLHESMHLFTVMEGIFAKENGITANQQAMLDSVGATSFESLTVEQHETLAESFEVYLREGKAPSLKLADSFGVFRSWLMNLYKNLRNLPNGKLNDDMRQTFDRLLATEAEIAEVAAHPEYQELFRSKEQSGMTDAEWAKYQQAIEKRKNRATTSVVDKIIKQLRTRKTREWKKEKAPLIEQEKERLSKLPVYQILSNTLVEPMNYAMVKEIVGGNKKVMGKLIGRAKKDGIPPFQYSEVHGYDSELEMLNDIANTESLNKAADRAAEQIMVAKHGDILNDGSIETDVHEALHTSTNADIVLAEIKALNKRKGDINRSLLKLGAKKLIGSMKHPEIQPAKYLRLERKAALKAERATDPKEKIAAKTQQLANQYLFNEATRVKADIGKWSKHIDFVRKHDYNTKVVDGHFTNAMKTIANLYRPKRKGKKSAEQTEKDLRAVTEFYNGQKDILNDRVAQEDPQLVEVSDLINQGRMSEFEFTYYEDMTADQLEGVYRNLKNLRFAGGKAITDPDNNRAAITNATAGAEANPKPNRARKRGYAGDKTIDRVKGFFAGFANLRNKIRKIDGFREDDQGASYDEVYLTVEDAHNVELDNKRKLFEIYQSELTDVNNVAINNHWFSGGEITQANGDVFKFSTEDRFMIALYWGTESSRKAIMEGHGITNADAMNIMSTMSDAELKLVNSMWKLNENMWSGIANTAIEHRGVAPKKLAATPFVVNGVEMTGGHQTIFYEGSAEGLSVVGEDVAGMFNQIQTNEATAAKERVGSGGRKVLLSKDNITRAIDENLHYEAFYKPSVKIAAIINDKAYKAAVTKKHGDVFYDSYVKNLQNIVSARPDREGNRDIAAFLKHIRRARTYSVLHYSLRNTVQQSTSIPIAISEVGAQNFARAAASLIGPEGRHNRDFIKSKSKFMANRAQLVNREANEFLRQIAIGGKVENALKVFSDHGFSMQTAVDSAIANPTWLAKYNDGMLKHGNEKVAISQADTAVSESVGSGADLHLGTLFQSTNVQSVKAITQFGSWFNNYYQRTYKATQGYGSFEHKRQVFSAMVYLPILVSVMNAALTMDLPKDDEEIETWVAKKYIEHLAGMVPIVGDAISSMFGWRQSGLLADAQSTGGAVVSLATKEDQSGLDTAIDILKIINTVIPISGSGQVIRPLEFISSDSEGNENQDNPAHSVAQALVKGKTRK